MAKFKSRKFWLALIGQVTGLVVLFLPAYETQAAQVASHVGGLLLMALTAWGYIHAEGKVDETRVEHDDEVKPTGLLSQRRSQMIALLILLPLPTALAGCSGVPAQPTRTYVHTVGERWIEYVENDPELTGIEKRTYKQFHRDFKKLVEDVADQPPSIFPVPLPGDADAK